MDKDFTSSVEQLDDGIAPDRIWRVAKAQKVLLVAVLVHFGVMVPRYGPIFYIAAVALSLWAIWNLAEALQTATDGFSTGAGSKWLVGACIPYGGIIVLIKINARATQFLKDAGYEVGLFGARRPHTN